MNLRIKTFLMLTILLIAIGVLLWQQAHLRSVLASVDDAIHNGISCYSAFGQIDCKISGNILDHLNQVQSDKTFANNSTLNAINRHYISSLIMTLFIAIFSASILSLLAYRIAMLIDGWEAQHQFARASVLEHLFDTLPYILWSIIGLSIAFTILGQNPASEGRYVVFLLLIYLGFGLFLLPFFVQENTRQFRQARNDGVFDGERMSGLSDKRIRLRLLRYRFSSNMARQILYAAIFMMLFDFSLYDGENVRGSYQLAYTPTVFVQASVYYKRNYQLAELQADSKNYRKLLSAFAEQAPAEHSAQPLVKQLLEQPWQLFVRANQTRLQQLIKQEPPVSITINSGAQLKTYDKNSLLRQLVLSKNEQNAIFFKQISDNHLYMNVLVLFGLFLVVFSLFDLRKLFQNA